ncbi:MAG TPA: hypothetical protein VHB21_07985 [Minicystis sp.]|nr:hypothetical protein [Minicystis sp.]
MTRSVFTTILAAIAAVAATASTGACGGGGGSGGSGGHHHTSTSGPGGAGGSGGSSAGGGTPIKQACGDYAHALCSRYGNCSNGFWVVSTFGDEMNCEFRLEQQCEAALLAPDAGDSGDDIEACATALPNESCIDLFDHNPPPACIPKAGPRENGAACGTGSQCKTGWCELDVGSTCGSCSGTPLAGSQCLGDVECGPGLVCHRGYCAKPVGNGAACNTTTTPCLAGLSCVGASMTTMGTCQPAGNTTGVACDPQEATAPGCNGALGLYCHPAIKKCEKTVLVDAGQPCGIVMNHLVQCKGDGKCQIPQGMAMGTCAAAIGDTQPCNVDSGPPCQTPSKCVPGDMPPDGVCTFPDPSVCGG